MLCSGDASRKSGSWGGGVSATHTQPRPKRTDCLECCLSRYVCVCARARVCVSLCECVCVYVRARACVCVTVGLRARVLAVPTRPRVGGIPVVPIRNYSAGTEGTGRDSQYGAVGVRAWPLTARARKVASAKCVCQKVPPQRRQREHGTDQILAFLAGGEARPAPVNWGCELGAFWRFSAGLRIWKEHMSVSSTLIIAPALSNSPQ